MRKILVEHHNKGRSKYHINFKYIIAYYLLLGCRLKVHEPGKAVATVPDRNKLLDLLVNSALESDLAKSVYTLGPKDLIRRYLPPGNWSDIYHLYISFQNAKNLQCASPTTFFRVVRRGGWKKVLRFRNVSQHTACPTCQKLKAELRHARDVAAHARSADRLMRHLQGQFQDRQIYWGLRTKAKRDQNILVCIQDSMDKGKYALPKFIDGRVPKHLAMLTRPVLEVTANIIHGRLIYVALADEGENAGSSWSLEVLNRALDKAYLQAQTKGLTWPAELRIWSDNTPKESLTISSNMVLKSKCKITLLRVIPTMTFIHFVTDISSGILPGISSGILSGILSGISSGILSGKSSGLLSGKHSGTLSGISSGILSDILSGILSGIPSGILSGISSGILSGIYSGTLSGILSYYAILSGISSGILSDILSGISSGILSGRWGPVVRTELGRSQVEVQRCALSWEGPRLRSSGAPQVFRSSSAHWARKLAKSLAKSWQGGSGGGNWCRHGRGETGGGGGGGGGGQQLG